MQRSESPQTLSTLLRHCTTLLTSSAYAPTSVPARYAQMTGVLRKEPITLHTQRFVGGHYRSVTLAWIVRQADDAVCSLTVIGLPTAASGAPILGVDLISLSGALSLVAVDLAPTDPVTFSAHAVPILEVLHKQTQGAVVHRKRPEFCQDTFSPLALICAARPGQEAELAPALESFLSMVLGDPQRLAGAGELAQPQAQLAWEKQRAWLRSEHANRKEANHMSLMFGEPAASDYLHNFLFEVPSV